MKYMYSKSHLQKVCEQFGMKRDMIDGLIRVLHHFEDYNLHPLDCVLTKDLYPITHPHMTIVSIKCMYSDWVKSCYDKNKDLFKRVFDYDKRPTLKKFIQLLFIECLV